jgi:hypothetical protein
MNFPNNTSKTFSSEVNKGEENINSSQKLLGSCDVFIGGHWAISYSGTYSKLFLKV